MSNNKERAENICLQVWDNERVMSSGAVKWITEELDEAEKRGMLRAAEQCDKTVFEDINGNEKILMRWMGTEIRKSAEELSDED